MAGHEGSLTGPDLAAGIAASDLTPGTSLLGHAHGEPVLLARVGEQYFAIGATCTHYGGPLAEGVLVGDTVRCPWHHACFSLRNGEALRAPALSPVPCYHVERRGDQVVVMRKEERDPLSPTYPAGNPPRVALRRVVIVGAGAAGSAAAEMLRRCGHEGSICVVDAEKKSPYDRPNLSKDYLAGNAPPEWIPLRPEGFYAEHGITFARARVNRLDTARKSLELEGHDPVAYDALILATGADPVHLGLPGEDDPRVHYLRSLADSDAIIAAAKEAKRVVVVGASFIGLEVAASLRTRGLDVHVVAPEALPLERVLGPQLGTFIKSLHEEQAGLAMDRGVTVDEYLRTSAPDVYAAGDIARWPDPHSGQRIRVEHWVVAQRMGQTAARNILGARERYEQVPFFWSAHYDVSINYVGHAEQWDRIVMDGDPAKRDVSVRYERAGKTLALATIFRDDESLRTEIDMEREVAG